MSGHRAKAIRRSGRTKADPYALAKLGLNPIEFMDQIVGPSFQPPEDWFNWRVVIKEQFALPMTPAEVEVFRQYTGRQTPPTVPSRKGFWVVGRRGGKDRISALLATYRAAAKDYRTLLGPGETAVVAVLAQNKGKATALLNGIFGLLESVPLLKSMIVGQTAETISLSNRTRIEVTASSFRSVRGGDTVVAAIANEIAFWMVAEDSANPASEVLSALEPTMYTVNDALMLCISSPYSRLGPFWTAFKLHYAHDLDPICVWRASTLVMHPSIDRKILDDAMAEDPVAARAEIEAFFREDLESFMSPEVMDAAIRLGWFGDAWQSGHTYYAFADLAGGAGQDSATLAIVDDQRRAGGKLVVVHISEYRPPFSALDAAERITQTLRSYHLNEVTGDRLGGAVHQTIFREQHRIKYVFTEASQTKSLLFRGALPLFTSQLVALPDPAGSQVAKRTVSQFLNLERTTVRGSNAETIGHPRGGFDDLANAVAGALVIAQLTSGRHPAFWALGEEIRKDAARTDPRDLTEEIRMESGVAVLYRRQSGGQWIANSIATAADMDRLWPKEKV